MDYLILLVFVLMLLKIGYPIYIRLTGEVTHYCKHCGSQVYPKAKTQGSFLIEVVLWLCFIIPGLIYTLWRATSKKVVCPVCENNNLIPITSPEAQRILSKD